MNGLEAEVARASRRVVLVGVVVLAGCEVQLEGAACNTNADCPQRQVCVVRDAGVMGAGNTAEPRGVCTAAGGAAGGGAAAGGAAAGGAAAGGAAAGGAAAGGAAAGGAAAGGAAGGGSMDAGVMRYTISANVTGLTGMGLKLSNNGSDPLTPAGNGVFAFATMLAPGAPYSVTVSQQPTNPWQTCMVMMNGAGTVASANVIVQVTCTTNTYTIGGNISGLSGQVTLQLTGSGQNEVLVISNVGGFTFSTLRIASGQQYTVTVSMNPPNQTCTVTNGTGTVTNADVTNVTVACSTNTYTVGGTVTNLDAGTLMRLSLNDAGSLSPMMNGSFTFPTRLENGQPYNVTVAMQPPPMNPLCRVINGAGTVMSMNVTTVIVDCSACVQAGMPCLQGGGLQCCMGSCVMTPTMVSRCQSCAQPGATCATNGECCTNRCTGLRCECFQANTPCNSNSDCCSNSCTASSGGNRTCQ